MAKMNVRVYGYSVKLKKTGNGGVSFVLDLYGHEQMSDFIRSFLEAENMRIQSHRLDTEEHVMERIRYILLWQIYNTARPLTIEGDTRKWSVNRSQALILLWLFSKFTGSTVHPIMQVKAFIHQALS